MLPIGYTQLEYIESHGTEYIDTGVKATSSLYYDFDFMLLSQALNPDTALFVHYLGIRNTYDLLCSKSSGRLGVEIQLKRNGVEPSFNVDSYINKRISISLKSNEFIFDGTSHAISISSFSSNYNIYLFACNNSNRPYSHTAMRVYGFKLYTSNSILRNFIPTLRNSDGELGMYDEVTGTFFTNQGTGKFVAGPKVLVSSGKEAVKYDRLPSEYQEVEYIESHGTEWIDTGVHFIYQDRFEIEFMKVSHVSGEDKGYGAGIDPSNHNITGGGRISSSKIAIFNASNAYFEPAVLVNESYGIKFREQTTIGTTLSSIMTNLSSGETYQAQKQLTLGSEYDSGNNVYLFRDNSVSYPYPSADKLYHWQHWRGNSCIRNLIPCKHNNEYGMYDLVSRQFFGNQGTGVFTGGNEVYHTIPTFKSLVVKKLLPEGYEISSSYKQIIKL